MYSHCESAWHKTRSVIEVCQMRYGMQIVVVGYDKRVECHETEKSQQCKTLFVAELKQVCYVLRLQAPKMEQNVNAFLFFFFISRIGVPFCPSCQPPPLPIYRTIYSNSFNHFRKKSFILRSIRSIACGCDLPCVFIQIKINIICCQPNGNDAFH